MSDKLQEIEKKLMQNITNAHTVCLTVQEGLYLIEQLEQAQKGNQKLIEVVEYYADRNNHLVRVEYSGEQDVEDLMCEIDVIYSGDFGYKASQMLSEVKGNEPSNITSKDN